MPNIHQITFKDENDFGEVGHHLDVTLSIDNKVAYFYLSINNGPAYAYVFHFDDSGTIWGSRVRGKYAIHGRLSNIGINWGTEKIPPYSIIHAIGNIDNGKAGLWLFAKSQTN